MLRVLLHRARAHGEDLADLAVGLAGREPLQHFPLARCALYAQGVDIYMAPTYGNGERCIATAQHIAREGGCWVVSSGFAFRGRDTASAMPSKPALFPDPDEWVNAGDSVVVAPGGKIAAGPLHESFGILYAEVDPERVGMARRSLDVVGHYARPDIFRLQVNRRPQGPGTFEDQDNSPSAYETID